jgi:hypothetical protein
MKSILYVGATLMVGASIYGFVNYEQTSKKKEFTNMYKETETEIPETKKKTATLENDVSKMTSKTEVSNKATAELNEQHVTETKKTSKKNRRQFDTKLFSRGALDERYIKEEKIAVEPAKEKVEAGKTEKNEQ